nr:RecName: Full=U-scoloptoxin(11)-Sm5a; Short=U-SLPTX(11)-Sm5a; Flags: Precursor [Scolopendra morsitans]
RRVFTLTFLFLAAEAFHLSDRIETRESETGKGLATCKKDSICAYLQQNARGVTPAHMCECPGEQTCPLSWDPDDGKTLTRGDEQYKFCSSPPQALHECKEKELVFTSKFEYEANSNPRKFLSYAGYIHCACPIGFSYHLTRRTNSTTEGQDLETVYFSCEEYKTCGTNDTCHIISESSEAFMIYKMCNCDEDLKCPTDPEAAFRTDHIEQVLDYNLYNMQCQ